MNSKLRSIALTVLFLGLGGAVAYEKFIKVPEPSVKTGGKTAKSKGAKTNRASQNDAKDDASAASDEADLRQTPVDDAAEIEPKPVSPPSSSAKPADETPTIEPTSTQDDSGPVAAPPTNSTTNSVKSATESPKTEASEANSKPNAEIMAVSEEKNTAASMPPEDSGLRGHLFRELDANNDGFLQAAELPEKYREAFEAADWNGDDRLSYPEFEAALSHWNPPDDDAEVTASKSEAPKPSIPVYQGKRAEKRAMPEWFDRLDRDEDGQVGLYEWTGLPIEEFRRYDRNGDGFITADEAVARP